MTESGGRGDETGRLTAVQQHARVGTPLTRVLSHPCAPFAFSPLPLLPVYTDGAICLDILANQWSPIYDVAAILASIQSLLTDPNPNSPANVEAAKLYVENRREYDRKVGEVIEGLWKLEEAEHPDDDDDDEEEEEDADAAPRKKQKITETTSISSNATNTDPTPSSTAAATSPAAATSSAPAASSSAPPVAAAASTAAAAL